MGLLTSGFRVRVPGGPPHHKEFIMTNEARIDRMYLLALRLNEIVEEMKSRK